MAEENGENNENDEITETDIHKQQEKTAELLYDVILKQQATATQPTYITRVEQPAKAAPNYLLYIAIAIGAFLMFRT